MEDLVEAIADAEARLSAHEVRAAFAAPHLSAAEGARAVVFAGIAARWRGLDLDGWRPALCPGLPELLREVTLPEVALSGADPLSSLYAEFLAARAPSGRRRTGTWYTPAAVVELMWARARVRLATEVPRVLDPTTGTGGFLVAAPPTARLWGQDRDPAALLIAAARLAGRRASLCLGDTLARPEVGPVDLIIGNPPWAREPAGAATGGWICAGHPEVAGGRPLFDDLRTADAGVHLKNLYNQYVYFWRWALWRAFERQPGPAVVALVTPASFLRGPGFGGLRALIRERVDGLEIVDLGGDMRGGLPAKNLFDVRTPACVTVAWRGGAADRHYAVYGPSLAWRALRDGRSAPLLPRPTGPYGGWPRLAEVFPWIRSGVKVGRTWTVATEPETLRARWRALMAAPSGARAPLFKDSPTGRRAADAIEGLEQGTPCPPVIPYAWRSFDVRWALDDPRLVDRPALDLRGAHGPAQRYLTTQRSTPLGAGPAATVTAAVPDLHHFAGRGGRDVIPWRDADGRPNVAPGVGGDPSTLFLYVLAVLGGPGFQARFAAEIAEDGLRVPITADPGLFAEGAQLGRRLMALSCEAPPRGAARLVAPVVRPAAARHHGQRLLVGDGIFAPVSEATWRFTISGQRTVRRFVAGRRGGGRRSSPLDEIRAPWTPSHSADLLALLWRLEALQAMYPALDAWLDRALWSSGGEAGTVSSAADSVTRRAP